MKKLNLFGPVYNSSWDDCVTANNVANFLKTLEDSEEFEVYINSPGGSVFEGLAIYNLLSEYSSRMTVKIIGEASSIASVIACAGSKIMIAETAMMLIHNPWTFSIVDEDYLKKLNKTLKTIKDSILKVYAKKMDMDIDDINQIMSESDYHSAEDCVKLGLADEVYTPSDDETKAISESEKIKNELVRKYMVLNFDKNSIDNNKELKMNIEQLQAQVSNLESLLAKRESEFSALKVEKENLLNELSTAKADMTELKAFKEQAEKDLAAKTQAIWEAEEKSFCEQLIADKKLTRAEYIGNSKDGELPAKVIKLMKLRNLDESLYKAEREEMSCKPSIQSLTQGLGEFSQEVSGDSLQDYIKNVYNKGAK